MQFEFANLIHYFVAKEPCCRIFSLLRPRFTFYQLLRRNHLALACFCDTGIGSLRHKLVNQSLRHSLRLDNEDGLSRVSLRIHPSGKPAVLECGHYRWYSSIFNGTIETTALSPEMSRFSSSLFAMVRSTCWCITQSNEIQEVSKRTPDVSLSRFHNRSREERERSDSLTYLMFAGSRKTLWTRKERGHCIVNNLSRTRGKRSLIRTINNDLFTRSWWAHRSNGLE